MAICLCIIFFNIGINTYIKVQPYILRKKQKCLQRLLNSPYQDSYKVKLLKKLSQVSYLKVFHEMIGAYETWDIPQATLEEIMSNLAEVYRMKQMDEKAYFAYVMYAMNVSYNRVYHTDHIQKLSRALKTFLKDESSIYVRENTFKAIIAIGIEEDIIDVLQIIQGDVLLNNQQFIQMSLSNFKGNQPKLAEGLYCHFESFIGPIQAAIIHYFRMRPKEQIHHELYQSGLVDLLYDKQEDEAVKLELVEYIHEYSYESISQKLMYMRNAEYGLKQGDFHIEGTVQQRRLEELENREVV